ncbi:hypothetical protein RI129_003254 [Pyrocoelia pectoralis]|uniref:Transposase Helix-turn-helix domain-containing protein n=1 Tax=Pyrocoelia pectoralis TaxID=417401 RepID=A0AAN7ZMU1_9COLE
MMDRILMLAIDDDVPNMLNAINHFAEGLMQPLDLVEANPDQLLETIPQFTDDLFKEHFRMSRRSFEILRNVVGHNMQNRSRIDLSKKLLFTISILAKSESFSAVGNGFGIAKSTAHGIFKDVIRVVSRLMPQYVRFPTPEELIAHVRVLMTK